MTSFTRASLRISASKWQKRGGKKNYLEACPWQRCHFAPFIVYVADFLCVKKEDMLKRISRRLVEKWNQTSSRKCGCIKSRVSITLVLSTHCFVRGSWVPTININVKIPNMSIPLDSTYYGKQYGGNMQ